MAPQQAWEWQSGFSLQTQIENRGLATRTKALALAILNANHQIGVTQFDSKAICTHCKSGELEIMIYQPIVHTYSENSFVYSVDLPDRQCMIKMYKGLQNKVSLEKNVFWFNPKNTTHQKKIKTHLEASLLLGQPQATTNDVGFARFCSVNHKLRRTMLGFLALPNKPEGA